MNQLVRSPEFKRKRGKEAQRTLECMRVVDEAFTLFFHRGLNTYEGLFTLSMAIARCIQTTQMDQREAMIESVLQIIRRAAIDMDQALVVR